MKSENLSLLEKQGHNWVNILCIIVLIISFVLCQIINALAGIGNSAAFNSSVGEVSAKYELDVTPAGWTFIIWVRFLHFISIYFITSNNIPFRYLIQL